MRRRLQLQLLHERIAPIAAVYRAIDVTDTATGRTWIEDVSDRYSPLQWKVMSTDAELIRQAAHLIATEHHSEGLDVEVRVDALVSLNGRRATRLIDPDVDLAHEPWRPSQPWITNAPTSPPP